MTLLGILFYGSWYLLCAGIFLFTAMLVAGDFEKGRTAVITPRMMLVAASWPLGLAWLLGAGCVDLWLAAVRVIGRRF